MLEMSRENLFPGNLRGELYDSVEKFGGVTLKKLKLGRDTPPHVDATQRKILKHQTKVYNIHDNWYQFHFCNIICVKINRGDFFLTESTSVLSFNQSLEQSFNLFFLFLYVFIINFSLHP